MEVDEADDKVQLTTFKVGLKSREFMVSLVKNPPKTIAKMLLKAQKYMNDEDALASIEGVESPRKRRKRRRTTEEDEKGIEQIAKMLKGTDGKMTKTLIR